MSPDQLYLLVTQPALAVSVPWVAEAGQMGSVPRVSQLPSNSMFAAKCKV